MGNVVEDIDLEIKKSVLDYNFGNTLVVRTVFARLQDETIFILTFT